MDAGTGSVDFAERRLYAPGGMVIPKGDHVPTFPPALRLQRRLGGRLWPGFPPSYGNGEKRGSGTLSDKSRPGREKEAGRLTSRVRGLIASGFVPESQSTRRACRDTVGGGYFQTLRNGFVEGNANPHAEPAADKRQTERLALSRRHLDT